MTENENPLYVIQTLQERDDALRDAVAAATAQLRREAEAARASAQAAEERLADYNRMTYQVECAERQCTQAEERRKESDRRRADAEAALNKAEKLIRDQKTRLEEAQQQAEILSAENENLLRINREHSNADRKLQPKKERSGYVLLSQRPREVRSGSYKYEVWETQLQTPYKAAAPYENIRQWVENELYELVTEPLSLIWEKETYVSAADKMDGNVIYKLIYKADYRAGYWIITLHHTRPLGVIPADLMSK